jgi:hypothetical protein
MAGPRILKWVLLLGVLGVNVYRAKTLSLTIDEAFTYKDYVVPSYKEALKHLDPNNHVLNTLLEKVTVGWFGPSELPQRLPSLAGGAIYMVSVLLLCELLFGVTWSSFIAFAALILNPIILDYMSAARGYSLGLGFEFLGVLLMAWQVRTPGLKTAASLVCVAIGVAFGLSAAANLTFLLPNAILAALFLGLPWLLGRKVDPEQAGLQAGLLAAAAGATLAELAFDTFESASSSTFYIGEASIPRSAYILFQRSFAYPLLPGGRLLPPILAIATIPLLLFGTALALKKRDEIALLLPLSFLGSLGALWALHYMMGVPYPYERTGIYFLPLMTLSVAYLLTTDGVLKKIGFAFLALVVVQYCIGFKTAWYEEWRFDAGTKRVLAELQRLHKESPRPLRLGISWQYEESGTYYRQKLGMDWLAPLTRTDIRKEPFDYYYLAPDDASLLNEKKLRVVYRDQISNAVLAAPDYRL